MNLECGARILRVPTALEDAMRRIIQSFLHEESGAVTVDWVVITAAVVGLSAISFFAIEDSSEELLNAAAGAVTQEDDF
jgi:Flp pilus assembly pilin Flp